jgi:hypothetical protein
MERTDPCDCNSSLTKKWNQNNTAVIVITANGTEEITYKNQSESKNTPYALHKN